MLKNIEIDGAYFQFTLEELAEHMTREFASKLLPPDEFEQFCKLQDDKWERDAKRTAESYYPGCYGDALEDC